MIDLDTPIEKLELSRRAYNGLLFDNIETVGQLVALTRADLLRIPRIGKWCLEEIEEVLACHGFKIKSYGEARPIGKPRGTWRPIETAPKDRWILAYQPHGMFAGKFYTGGHWYVCKWAAMDEFWYDKSTNVLEIQPGEEVETTFHTCIPTHWMPLPEAPK